MVKETDTISRYSHPCPACGAIILASQIHLEGESFPCPHCGEWLTYANKNTPAIIGVSVLLAVAVALYMGYRGLAFLIGITVLGVLLFFLGLVVEGIFAPPGFKRVQGKPFDKTPSLFVKDKTGAGKKTDP